MIAVIADDFTGAAEIGGVGLRYGLKTVIETTVNGPQEIDLLVIATDLRSMEASQAISKVEQITRQVLSLGPEFVFKKMDSALRGNIAQEIKTQLSVMGLRRAVLVPGNPALGRVITKGHYYIHGTPLNRTFFASAVDFPKDSSSVEDIISRKEIRVISRTVRDELPEHGIIVGDVSSMDDLSLWADRIDPSSLAAGGAGFFGVLLGKKFQEVKKPDGKTYYLRGKSLFIKGSRFPKNEKITGKIFGDGLVRMNMPEALYRDPDPNPDLLEGWASEIIEQLNLNSNVVVAIDHKSKHEPGSAKRVKENIGRLIRMIFDQVKIEHLLIEGGATTYEVLRNLEIKKLYPCRELGPGIIQLRVDAYPDLRITTKPGSYDWPDNVEFKNEKLIKR